MSQNARSHRKLKIAGIVALVLVVALLGFAGNFLFDFALNPQAPYTMKMMQDGKDDKKGEQPDAEETEARAWFKENRESSSLTADDGTELAAWYFAASENTHDYAVCLHGYTNEPIGMARYAKRFHDRGMNVLAPAARAHERSAATISAWAGPSASTSSHESSKSFRLTPNSTGTRSTASSTRIFRTFFEPYD